MLQNYKFYTTYYRCNFPALFCTAVPEFSTGVSANTATVIDATARALYSQHQLRVIMLPNPPMGEEHVIVVNDVVQLMLVMSLVLVPLSECSELIGWSSSKFNTPLQATCSGEFVKKAVSI
eukprot:13945305-Ditylum_brightwellii.AAC.1